MNTISNISADVKLPPDFFDQLPSGSLLLDENDVILRANTTILVWLGLTKDDLVGKRMADLLPMGGKLFYASSHAMRETLEGGVDEASYDLRCADGSLLPVFMATRKLNDGNKIYLLAKADLRRRYEQQLLEAKRLAEEVNLSRATFLNTVTHEVRTPIHAILGIAELIADTPLNTDQNRLLRVLQESGSNLLALVNDVLDLSRADTTELKVNAKATDVNSLIDTVVASLRPSLRSDQVRLESAVSISCPRYMMIDAGKVRQVLTNLLSNAIKFTETGYVRIETSCRGPVDAHDNSMAMTFSVIDTGPGIAAKEHQFIFQPFSQASNNHSGLGTGLGLSISQRIIQALGGQLHVESSPGKGSTFSFTLNTKEAQAPAFEVGGVTLGHEESVSFAGRRVLVVDDNPTNIFIARRHLRSLNIETLEAQSGEEAVSLASQQTFDLILLDLRMPGIDGYEAAAQIREISHHQHTPLIAVTAASFPEKRSAAEEAYFAERILKPFTNHQLVEALHRYLKPVVGIAKGTKSKAAPVAKGQDKQGATVDFQALAAEFPNEADRADFHQLVQIMQSDLKEEATGLVEAARVGNTRLVRDRRHKLNSILKLANPQPLANLIDHGADDKFNGNRETLATSIAIAITQAIKQMKEFARELKD